MSSQGTQEYITNSTTPIIFPVLDQVLQQSLFQHSLPARQFHREQQIVQAAALGDALILVHEGWLAHAHVGRSGRRQLTGLLLPGEIGLYRQTLFDMIRHRIIALTDARISFISLSADCQTQLPASLASNLVTAIDRRREATLRTWLAMRSDLDALERMAHLICELDTRLNGLRNKPQSRFALPITQEGLADILGLTSVHVNRTLAKLRELGLFTTENQIGVIEDVSHLRRLGSFDPGYLGLLDCWTETARSDVLSSEILINRDSSL